LTSDGAGVVPAGNVVGAGVVAGANVTPFELSPHNCFACGSLNVSGIGLRLHVERGKAWADTTLDVRFQGWNGMAHGGIICALLDEVMAWSLVGEDNWGVTARMSVEFKRPIPIGQPVHAEGLVTRSRRRLVETAGTIADAGGTVLATAVGLYVAADEARKRELREQYGFRLLNDATAAATEAATPESVDRLEPGRHPASLVTSGTRR
jgi:uncharacterized protein (TIGR00369 family)